MECTHDNRKEVLARWNKITKNSDPFDNDYCSVLYYCKDCGDVIDNHIPTDMGRRLTFEEGLERYKDNNYQIVDLPYFFITNVKEIL